LKAPDEGGVPKICLLQAADPSLPEMGDVAVSTPWERASGEGTKKKRGPFLAEMLHYQSAEGTGQALPAP